MTKSDATTERLCRICGTNLTAESMYSKKAGLICRECQKKQSREWYYKNKQRRIDANRNWRHRNPDRKIYKADRSKSSEWQKRRMSDYPHEYRARGLVFEALQSGALTKPSQCDFCECDVPLVGHHEDYDKPLDVTWLCYMCHGLLHAEQRKVHIVVELEGRS